MEQVPLSLPVLPIRNAVLYPSVSMPLVVGRGKSLKAIEIAENSSSLIIVVAQHNLTPGDPEPKDLYRVGTLCRLESVSNAELGSRQVVVTGLSRYRIGEFKIEQAGYLTAMGEVVSDVPGPDPIRTEALFYNLKELSHEILELLPGSTEHLSRLIERVEDAGYLANICAAYLNLSLTQKQELLETVMLDRRMEMLLDYMRKERELLSVQRDIRDKMSERINKAQREALLREQMRTIRSELGEEESEEAGHEDLERKVREADLPEEATKQANEELSRLKGLPVNSAEYHVVRTYLEWLSALPWNKRTHGSIDVARARTILDEDHYGLEVVKKRILQFLAVAKLKNDLHGPILCLVGPPGVGKTSLGQSIARALERKFIRTSLGGVRDEAEIRGHRRTYVGAMPGRIIQSIKRGGSKNPVMMLDEIDKLRSDFHGDPSAAMLEVLDPEQNRSFTDHYLDIPFDLSEVFFICTANVTDTIPPALRDRMETIEVTGYTSEEKLRIACRYLIPKQIREHGLKPEWIEIPDVSVDRIITHYTREAGVRELQRQIAALMRAVAEEIVSRTDGPPAAGSPPSQITLEKLVRFLGPERFFPEPLERTRRPGIAIGMAWTPHGGDLLYIEATAIPAGKGNLTLTGQLGDVMKESALIALSYARSASIELLRKNFDFASHDIHIHIPSGAIPKDGPSAGITMLCAIASLLLDQPVAEGVAMTGEITLRGAVLPVGGIKEKVLAAHRGRIRKIILPRRNEQDLHDVPENVRKEMTFAFVDGVDQVLTEAFPGSTTGGTRLHPIPPAAA